MTALYATTIHHARQTPIRHTFTYRSYWWLVDLDALPTRFRAQDHVGDPALSIRANLDTLLAAQGISASRILMLTSARTLGHVFNPISVHWCLSSTGGLVAIVVEVHNTYGGRHAYVLRPDADGWAGTEKVFYVSPFHPVDGHYEMHLPVPGSEVRLDVTYHRPGARPFVATVRGTRTPLTPRVRLALACSTRLVSLRIRVQGIRLFLRRLPVVPRPPKEQTP